MKKWCLFLSVYLCLCVLAACGAAGSGAPVPGGTPSGEAQAGGETAQPASVTVTCRVVAAEDGQLLLAGQGDDTNIYTLFREEDDLHPGEVVKVCYSGGLLETWPVQFGGVASAEVCPGGFDDLCVLYLRVLEDLWTVDPGLNGEDLTYIGVDLSDTSLSDSEQAAVAWTFAARHGGEPVSGTWEELADQGYIDKEHLQWEDGCLFTITEKPVVGSYDLRPIAFDAQKWRSGLGAYYFADCTSVQAQNGLWQGYNIGAEAIS